MKRLIVFLLILSFLVASVGCSGSDDTTYLSREEYNKKFLEPYLTEDQSDHLYYLYRDYGVEIRVDEYWDKDEGFYHYGTVDPEEYGEIIDYIYTALRIIGTDDKTQDLLWGCIDTISCIPNMEFNNVEYLFYKSPGYYWCDNFYFSYNPDLNPQVLAANIMWFIAYQLPCLENADDELCWLDEDKTTYRTAVNNLTNVGFCGHQYNGFSNYNKNVTYNKQKYSNILKNNGITDESDILTEYHYAGLLYERSSISALNDFADYIYQLMLPSSEIWNLYRTCEPVRIKTDAAISYISAINPLWNKGFFISLSEPENVAELYEPISSNDGYSDLIAGAVFTGTYQSTKGKMNAVLEITSIDALSGDITAEFSFSPAVNSYETISGKYSMTGSFDIHTNSLSLTGVDWISGEKGEENMLDIDGMLFTTRFVGSFSRDDLGEVALNRTDESYSAE